MNKNKRLQIDVMQLFQSNYEVKTDKGSLSEFSVKFFGPENSPYEEGVWDVLVQVPDEYPYKSPSIGFKNRIFHPNIDFDSGSVCLDVINQTWSPVFNLINIFDIFLPQLLLYPNPTDPLNHDAANLQTKDLEAYQKYAKEMVKKYALNKNYKKQNTTKNENEDNNQDELSDLSGSEELSDLSGAEGFSDSDL
ncbi:ubiquitin-conjugating enzyme e2 h [Anaeramoeba flamelloides]|uniref:Ubiquitin-conjugating enzyme E2 H n=1 Tax=Anaeramoeba flamelloides TaxID=1746091 RepID=A0AAV7Z4C4_9EUKA|nr:ubiquitin-conjugating enzyme e2 h [Anaeramoeba flamelloides]KAJ6238384.1 ubiquitin-conjugating enzyme e2 h [Anaeramoeba flamelloides]